MRVAPHDSFASFRRFAEPSYLTDPVRHTIPVTVLAEAREYEAGTSPVLLTLHEAGTVLGAYFRTPPFPGDVGALPCSGSALPETVEALRAHDPEPGSLRGPAEFVDRISAEWCRQTGASRELRTRQRLYRLGTLDFPVEVDGEERGFFESDVTWLADWRAEYARDAGDVAIGTEPSERRLRSFMDSGRVPVLWSDGVRPVSMAFYTIPRRGMSRIGNVYTPSRFRRNGYGAAVTASAARRAWRAGASRIVLFADLANPTSNSVYLRLGFRPVHDTHEIALHPV
ncbi:FR47-like protein [Actinopolyspora xinjiangensis]|uniref:FR47-like protein n=1 Tax=Actinopolyspora xinjiangensis TaxID=405564 RepID=A0A1H0TDQ9_9ACTN|nr:GNAT family N-acetyltransferase [Actinopolyspora xinjiangensis]SDP52167.1 FR47-like protein [Actinopolyspora xinjiangensis]